MATKAAPKQTSNFTLKLPQPHPGQLLVLEEAQRYNVVACGRRFGKSQLGLDRVIQPALEGFPTSWHAPSYATLQELWRSANEVLKPVIARRDSQQHRLELITGGVLEMWSLDNPDSSRGRKYKRVVIDEAAMVPDLMEAWERVVMPTLADLQGDAWFLSTPRGLNAFYDMFMQGQSDSSSKKDGWASWRMPTSVNPYILPSEIELMRQTMTARSFQQEILAEFIADGVGVFRNVGDCSVPLPADGKEFEPEEEHQYCIGADWGRTVDYTVFVVFDITTRRMVHIERTNQVEYHLQRERLARLIRKWRPITVIAEENSIGQPILEELNRADFRVQPFTMTNATKAAAVDAFALALENRTVTILQYPELLRELTSFTYERTPSGLIRYAAPGNQHDDTVVATILAWQGVVSHSNGMIDFYRRLAGPPKKDKEGKVVLGPNQAALAEVRKRRQNRELLETIPHPDPLKVAV